MDLIILLRFAIAFLDSINCLKMISKNIEIQNIFSGLKFFFSGFENNLGLSLFSFRSRVHYGDGFGGRHLLRHFGPKAIWNYDKKV